MTNTNNKTPTRETKAKRQAKIERDAARYKWLRDKSDPDKLQPYVAQERKNS